MIEMLDFKTIVDIGFVVFVLALCSRSVSGQHKNDEQLAIAWKAELEQLANSLRELVDEASASSRNLDRRLGQKQKELERLLNEIEARSTKLESEDEDDLPNDSWRMEARPNRQVTKAAEKYSAHTQKIERALQQKREKELAQQPRNAAKRPATAAPSLASQVEVSSTISDAELLRNNPTSITDPAALSIAKRLLLAGKELHVVARKLEVPIAEIRELEIYLRGVAGSEPARNQSSRNSSTIVELDEASEEASSLEALVDEIEDRSFV